ncbi:hypothetical protein MANES_03G056817v8 [Manihot esculenta]|uniref:Uncharacterized protein n=1 Tax=Manihot esculenta TaxID=3983 RepID=A0ACB7I091_MANES|nr:hypothetical protein MANES_03G056817v8 [Manihot esculenta]
METSSRKPIIIEINLISAQDLRSGRRSSATQMYVVAYLNPNQKLTSRIVKHSHCHTWNDKFIFALELDDHLTNNSCIVFEIFRVRRFMKDKRIGVVRVMLDSLISKDRGRSEAEGPKFAAFHVRTPAGEPMGILNIGVATLNVMFHQQLPKFLSSNYLLDYF